MFRPTPTISRDQNIEIIDPLAHTRTMHLIHECVEKMSDTLTALTLG